MHAFRKSPFPPSSTPDDITSMSFASTTGRRDFGTTTVIRPAPIRMAALPARQGAPVIPGEPPIT